MLLAPDSDQQLLRETTTKFLSEHAPVRELRRLRDEPGGFEPEYWRRGADLGWTSLLVGEDHGGGYVSGQGLVDLSIISYEFGRHAAPGPLAVTNVVAATLSELGGLTCKEVMSDVLSGESIATWCLGEPQPNDRIDSVSLDV